MTAKVNFQGLTLEGMTLEGMNFQGLTLEGIKGNEGNKGGREEACTHRKSKRV